MQLKNKKAIITGGSQGIGKGIAIALAKAGADIILQYRTAEDKAFATINEIKNLGRMATALQSDFNENDSPEKFIESSLKELKTADILVNCAAAYERGSFLEITKETFSWMHKINVEVPLRLIQKFSQHLIDRKTSGSIINISSISSLSPVNGSCLNSCSKASLNMLTQCGALELAKYQIRVNGIAPGATETESNLPYIKQDPEIWRQTIQKIPLARAGKPEDYAGLAVFLASDESSWLTEVTIPVDGGSIISWQ